MKGYLLLSQHIIIYKCPLLLFLRPQHCKVFKIARFIIVKKMMTKMKLTYDAVQPNFICLHFYIEVCFIPCRQTLLMYSMQLQYFIIPIRIQYYSCEQFCNFTNNCKCVRLCEWDSRVLSILIGHSISIYQLLA